MPAHFHIVHPGACASGDKPANRRPPSRRRFDVVTDGTGHGGLCTTRVRSPRKNKNVAFPLQAPTNLPWKDEGLRKDMAPPLNALSP
jgi:hypothetical protein